MPDRSPAQAPPHTTTPTEAAPVLEPATIDRPLSSSERGVWLLDRVAPLNGVLCAELEGVIDEDHLSRALAAVQLRHPLLRVRVMGEEAHPRFVPTGRPIPVERVRGEVGAAVAEVERALATPFTPDSEPLARVTIAPAPGGAMALVFSYHHVVGDGIGSAAVLRDLARSLADLAAGGMGALPFLPARPPLAELRPRARRGLAMLPAYTHWTLRAARRAVSPPRLLPVEQAPYAVRRTRLIHRELDAAQTASLAALCRREGTTVQGALVAAHLLAVARDMGLAEPASVGCFSAVNLREQLVPRIGEEMGLYISTATTFHRIAQGDPLWPLAREVKAELSAVMDEGEQWMNLPLLGLLVPRGTRDLPLRFAARVDGAAPSAVGVTNLGRVAVPERIGSIGLRALHAALSLGLVNPAIACCSTFAGRLVWNQLYVEPLVTAARATALADTAIALLLADA